ncbi:MAG: MATE family efflux transporter [Defluviitaleaceae bacterium]|nr:MATE family efflux transporter [Defluviitaleaceae bacterium]
MDEGNNGRNIDEQRVDVEEAGKRNESEPAPPGSGSYNKMEQRMAAMDIRRLIFENSIPTIFGIMMFSLYNTSNRFWVSRIPEIGPQALAAVSYILPIMLLKFGFAMLVGIGSAANISISLGKRDRARAEQVLGNVLSISAIVSGTFTLLGLIFRNQVLDILGVPADVRQFAEIYYTFHIVSIFLVMMYYGLNHPIRAAGNQVRFAKAQILMAGLNIVLDPILIIWLGLGVAGAGAAMMISMTTAGLYIVSYYFTDKSTLKLRLFNLVPRKAVVFAIVALGFSSFLIQLLGSAVHVFMNSVLTRFGEIEFGEGNGHLAVAAMAIVHVIFQLAVTPVVGINQGTQPVVGFNYGAKNYQRVKSAYSWSIIYGIGICTIGGAIVLISPYTIVAAFTEDPYIRQTAVFGLRAFMGISFIVGFNMPTFNFFTAIGRPKLGIWLTLLRQLIILVPAYLILTGLFGFTGFWFAMPVAEVLSGLIGVVLITREFKELKIRLRNSDATSEA